MNSQSSPNIPSPLVPQGSMLDHRNSSRSRVKVAFFCVIGVHVVGLMVLLMQGCKRENTPPPGGDASAVATNQPIETPATNIVQPVDNNVVPNTNIVVDTHQNVNPPPVPTGEAQVYLVQQGDSFSSIAKKYPGVTVKMIQEANPTVNPLKLQLNQKITIPPPTAPKTTTQDTTTAPANGEQIYVVKSNDTLDKISKQYGVTVKAIQSANNLSSTRINVGQKLKIPAKAAAPPAVPNN